MSPMSSGPADHSVGWQALPIDEARTAALAAEIGVRRLTAAILLGRGLGEPARASRFLAPRLADLRRPEGMADLERTLDRLAQALARARADRDLRRLRRRRRDHGRGAGGHAAGAGRRRDRARRQPPLRLRRRPGRRRALRRRGLRRPGHRRLRHQRPRCAGGGTRARHRRDRDRPPPGAVGRERGVRAHQSAPSRRPLPVQGARVVRRCVLSRRRAAHAPRRRRRSLRSARSARPGGAGNGRGSGAAHRREPHPGRRRAANRVDAQASGPARAGRAGGHRARRTRSPPST